MPELNETNSIMGVSLSEDEADRFINDDENVDDVVDKIHDHLHDQISNIGFL